jgi:hypothetical protein
MCGRGRQPLSITALKGRFLWEIKGWTCSASGLTVSIQRHCHEGSIPVYSFRSLGNRRRDGFNIRGGLVHTAFAEPKKSKGVMAKQKLGRKDGKGDAGYKNER